MCCNRSSPPFSGHAHDITCCRKVWSAMFAVVRTQTTTSSRHTPRRLLCGTVFPCSVTSSLLLYDFINFHDCWDISRLVALSLGYVEASIEVRWTCDEAKGVEVLSKPYFRVRSHALPARLLNALDLWKPTNDINWNPWHVYMAVQLETTLLSAERRRAKGTS